MVNSVDGNYYLKNVRKNNEKVNTNETFQDLNSKSLFDGLKKGSAENEHLHLTNIFEQGMNQNALIPNQKKLVDIGNEAIRKAQQKAKHNNITATFNKAMKNLFNPPKTASNSNEANTNQKKLVDIGNEAIKKAQQKAKHNI